MNCELSNNERGAMLLIATIYHRLAERTPGPLAGVAAQCDADPDALGGRLTMLTERVCRAFADGQAVAVVWIGAGDLHDLHAATAIVAELFGAASPRIPAENLDRVCTMHGGAVVPLLAALRELIERLSGELCVAD